MDDSLTYILDHSISRVEINLLPGRLVVNTQGKGALDRLRTIDITLSALEHFTVVPTVLIQNVIHARHRTEVLVDDSYNAEFIFTYRNGNKLKKKRVFVNRLAPEFQLLLQELERARPDASLTRIDPAEALKKMGVMTASSAVKVVVGLLVVVPILAAVLAIIFR
jgi:hypothetical protein